MVDEIVPPAPPTAVNSLYTAPPPLAPRIVTVRDVTPTGTANVCAPPVYANVCVAKLAKWLAFIKWSTEPFDGELEAHISKEATRRKDRRRFMGVLSARDKKKHGDATSYYYVGRKIAEQK
jgi:hypothetical protein